MRTRTRRQLTATALTASLIAAAGALVTAPDASATNGTSGCGSAALLGVRTATGELNRWVDTTPTLPGGFTHSVVAPTWGGARLLASDSVTGALFGVFADGKLRKYTYSSGKYVGGTIVGPGWANVKHLLPQGNGVLYAIFNDGVMRYYRIINGATQPGSGTVIGTGWNMMRAVASGGFAGPAAVGTGWNQISRIVGAGHGLIYAIDGAGVLKYYNHQAPDTGAASWTPDSGKAIGNSWSAFKAVTVNPNACYPNLAPS